MKRPRKSKRVSWPPDVNLCQVRLFLREDCPSKVGSQAENHLKPAGVVQHSKYKECNDLPPGFEGNYCLKQSKDRLLFVPKIEWKCPPRFSVSRNWRVASGENSHEVESQKCREMRVFEAVYPRHSSIPPCPAVSLDIEEDYDDNLTPVIPLTPIEEEEVAHTPSDLPPLSTSSLSSHPPALSQGSKPSGVLNSVKCSPPICVPSAVEKMLSNLGVDTSGAIMKSKEERNNLMHSGMVDTHLLVTMLSSPQIIESLETLISKGYQEAGAPIPTLNPVLVPQSCPKLDTVSNLLSAKEKLHHPPNLHPPSNPITRLTPSSCPNSGRPMPPMPAKGGVHSSPSEVLPAVSRTSVHLETGFGLRVAPSFSNSMPECNFPTPHFETVKPNPVPYCLPPTSGMMTSKSNMLPGTSVPTLRTNPVKDVNYFKNLIREHGTEKNEMQDRSRLQNGSNYNQNLNVKVREGNSKFQKACMYFKSSRGCRNGSKCPYQHDTSFQLQTGNALEMPVAKRMKLSAEATGRA